MNSILPKKTITDTGFKPRWNFGLASLVVIFKILSFFLKKIVNMYKKKHSSCFRGKQFFLYNYITNRQFLVIPCTNKEQKKKSNQIKIYYIKLLIYLAGKCMQSNALSSISMWFYDGFTLKSILKMVDYLKKRYSK